MKVKAEFPEKMESLFEPMRYKVYYGGRGGGKSHSVAKALVIMGTEKTLRILCTRELQRSISESVHKLLCDQIDLLGLNSHYTITHTHIKGRNGTEFFFSGLHPSPSNSVFFKSCSQREWAMPSLPVRNFTRKQYMP